MDANTSTEFQEYTKSSNMVWKHFLRSTDHQLAKCKLCHVVIKTTGRTTTGLHTHLRSKHGIDTKLLKPDDSDISKTIAEEMPFIEESSELTLAINEATTSEVNASLVDADIERPAEPTRKRKITDYFQVIDSVPMRVSRMVSKDEIDFKNFTESETMRYLFENSGYTLPKSLNCIKEMVMNYGSEVKKRMNQQIAKIKLHNQKFYLTVDEWTATGNRRYLNLVVHTNVDGVDRLWDIGLIRITGCIPAEVSLKLIKHKLQEFGLDLDTDIVAITTYGDNVINKIGRSVGPSLQLCCARILQETILDVFYARRKDTRLSYKEDSNHDSESDDEGDGLEMSLNHNEKFIVTTNSAYDEELQMSSPKYTNLRKKMRKIVRMFKKSQSKSNLLQNYVRQELPSEWQLISDKRGRWDTLVIMFERFQKLKPSICKVQVDLKLDSEYCLTEEEFCLIDELYEAFQPFKIVVERMCKNKASLATAQRLLASTVNLLEQRKTALSKALASSLQIKMKQQETNLIGVLTYLHTPKKIEKPKISVDIEKEVFPNEAIIANEIVNLLERLLIVQPSSSATKDPPSAPDDGFQDEGNDSVDPLECAALVKAEPGVLERSIEMDEDRDLNIDRAKLEIVIKKEIASYESEGKRGKYLKMVYNYLDKIPPVSINAEAAYTASSTGNCIECYLDDDTIDVLFLLRKYFISNIF